VGNADVPGERMRVKLGSEILELPLSSAPLELAIDDGADPGRVIAAIFQSL